MPEADRSVSKASFNSICIRKGEALTYPNSARIKTLPEKMPEAPKPATALATAKAIAFSAVVQTKDPTPKKESNSDKADDLNREQRVELTVDQPASCSR